MALFSKGKNNNDDLVTAAKSLKIPKHIAIIMDGNGRWAKKRGMPRSFGHAAGSENFRRIAMFCKNIGLEYLTVYAFSTENWKRPADEVSGILDLLRKYLDEALDTMEKDHIRTRFLGDLSRLPADIVERMRKSEDISKKYEGFLVCICVNYGGRDDIVRAVKKLQSEGLAVSEENINSHLDTSGIPDPDICIRPSGEYRISNFLIWQSAYTEFYFTKTLFPDLSPIELVDIIKDFNNRSRRFGGI